MAHLLRSMDREMAHPLRARFLAALTASGVVSIAACGGAVADDPPQGAAAADAGADAGPDAPDRCANREVYLPKCNAEARHVWCFPLGQMGGLSGQTPCFEPNGCVQLQDLR